MRRQRNISWSLCCSWRVLRPRITTEEQKMLQTYAVRVVVRSPSRGTLHDAQHQPPGSRQQSTGEYYTTTHHGIEFTKKIVPLLAAIQERVALFKINGRDFWQRYLAICLISMLVGVPREAMLFNEWSIESINIMIHDGWIFESSKCCRCSRKVGLCTIIVRTTFALFRQHIYIQ